MSDCKNENCCCKCKNYLKVTKHPWNQNQWSKGRADETMGYGCIVSYRDPSDKEAFIMFSDSEHGECELFDKKKINMTVAELRLKLNDLPDEGIIAVATSNFEQGNSTVEMKHVSLYPQGKIEERNFRDAFDGGTYTSKVINIIGGNQLIIKLS